MAYEIQVRHEGLHKYRAIRGSDFYGVEQKAQAQVKQWEEMWDREQASEAKRAAREQRANNKEGKLRIAIRPIDSIFVLGVFLLMFTCGVMAKQISTSLNEAAIAENFDLLRTLAQGIQPATTAQFPGRSASGAGGLPAQGKAQDFWGRGWTSNHSGSNLEGGTTRGGRSNSSPSCLGLGRSR